MDTEQIKDILLYLLGIASTIIALNRDYLSSRLFNRQTKVDIKSTVKDVENKQLLNVEKEINIYRDLLGDTKQRFETTINDLREEIQQLKDLVKEQKAFILKQAMSLDYYEKKCKGCSCGNKD